MSFVFGTKAETLERLRPLVSLSRLCDQLVIGVSDWRAQRTPTVEKVLKKFGDQRLVVRSSARNEDGWEVSMAGAYLSVIGLEPRADVLERAVDDVIQSYGEAHNEDQVLVQPLVEDVVISGVVMTRELNTGGPYYVINYDDFSGRTDSVTGGAESKTLLVHRARSDALHSRRMRALVETVMEIEKATACIELDIEFCITAAENVYALQVRPMAAKKRWQSVPDARVDAALDAIRTRLEADMAPRPGLLGKTTIYGEMPDWNPAEMIGNTPKPLAYSIYRDLITNSAWARARANMGYRNLDGQPLMVDFAGKPFIDVRLSLNSFLPADLDEGIAGRLVDFQLGRLADNPALHDKVEFEIATTCLDFNFEGRRPELAEAGFLGAEIEAFRASLWRMTRGFVEGGAGQSNSLFARTEKLEALRKRSVDLPPRERVKTLLTACQAHGIVPFSELARHGFVGVSFLRSLEALDVLEPRDADRFLRSVHTVAAEIVEEMHAFAEGKLALDKVLARYGHLRPGTYDITSPRYDEQPELYLGHAVRRPDPMAPFELSGRQRGAIAKLIDQNDLPTDPDGLFAYISESTRLREKAKFVFTRSISDALSALAEWGAAHSLSRDDLAFLDISYLFNARDIGSYRDVIASARDAHHLTRTIKLPHLIIDPGDIDVVRLPLGQPNYITHGSVRAPTAHLTTEEAPDIDGRIVLIEGADPGFDWIFSHRIAGLVTKFGGANSHMAIRCAEFGLPAAIGCGERLFEMLLGGNVIELDCGAHTVRVSGR